MAAAIPARGRVRSCDARVAHAEAILWRELKALRGLGLAFEQCCALDRYVVAFYCAPLSLAIGVESVARRGPRRVLRGDALREARLTRLGITLLSFSDEEVVHNLDGVVGRVRRWIRSRPAGRGRPAGRR